MNSFLGFSLLLALTATTSHAEHAMSKTETNGSDPVQAFANLFGQGQRLLSPDGDQKLIPKDVARWIVGERGTRQFHSFEFLRDYAQANTPDKLQPLLRQSCYACHGVR